MSITTFFQAAAVGGVVGLVINAPMIARYLLLRKETMDMERRLNAPLSRVR